MKDEKKEDVYDDEIRSKVLLKNVKTVGASLKDGFQLGLKDPLDISVFPVFELPCCPLLGVYGEEYQTMQPIILLKGDESWIAEKIVPAPLLEVLDKSLVKKIQFFMEVHTDYTPSPCQHFLCDRKDEINLMHHTWVFPRYKFGDDNATTDILCGIFAPHGVSECHQDINRKQDRGVSFGRLEARTVEIHDFAFSPCNCHIRVEPEVKAASFWSCAVLKGRSSSVAVTFHTLLVQKALQRAVKRAVGEVKSLDDLVKILNRFVSRSRDPVGLEPAIDFLKKVSQFWTSRTQDQKLFL